MKIKEIKEVDKILEVDILNNDGWKIGFAKINVVTKELDSFKIYEPFQNKSYEVETLKLLIEAYSIINLVVLVDNCVVIFDI